METIIGDIQIVQETLDILMGFKSHVFVKEISETGMLSKDSYDFIMSDVKYNSEKSIVQCMGVIVFYHILWLRKNTF
jgi:hypothetical protein